jgi:hypothetical protein
LRREANADHAVTKKRDAHFGGTGRQFNAVWKFLHSLHVSDVLPTRRHCAARAEQAEQHADSGPSCKP